MTDIVPQSIAELKAWMAERCYTGYWYNLDGGTDAEGNGIERDGDAWVWYFTERGNFQPLKRFATEAEIVAHAFPEIRDNWTARRHMVGFTKTKIAAERLIGAVRARGIACTTDSLLWRAPDDHRHRVFVMGCDINTVRDLTVDER